MGLAVWGALVNAQMTFQSEKSPSPLCVGANEVACPEGGLYSAGPGYRAQLRDHFCYDAAGKTSLASVELYLFWLTGTLSLGGGAALLWFIGAELRRKAARLQAAAANLA
jgi:hypothetical protein